MSKQGSVVIDWVDASQGNYHTDIFRTLLLMQLAEDPELRKAVNGYGEDKFGEFYKKRYSRIKEISQDLLDEWMLPVVAARFE